jgi:3-phosphoshikimate 1-carboxyvinyltransferase
MNPGRRAIVDLLRQWGGRIEVTAAAESLGEPVADLRVRAAERQLAGGRITPEQVPGLIDELPLLGLLAPMTREGIEVRGAAELRVKESDRIRSTCDAVRALQGQVEEYPDGFAVAGSTGLAGGRVDAADDHRIALGAAAVSVAAAGAVEVTGAAAADVSYPGFLTALEEVRQ